MADGHLVDAAVEGRPQRVKLSSPVDRPTLDRLAGLTFAPLGGVHVCFHVPTDPGGRNYYRTFKEKVPGMAAYVGYTMFETDRIPEPWIDACNEMDEIWVPTRFNLETFSGAGVRREKLQVIPFEFDPAGYRPEETPPLEIGGRKGFNFLSIFEWTHRKGWDVLIRAYLEAFTKEDDVRLILRAYQGGGVIGRGAAPVIEQLKSYIIELGYDPDRIPEIEFIDWMVSDASMPGLYRAADAFVLPTRGEGWGIPFTESMLMEVPVIATRWSSHLEFMNDENAYLIDIDGLVPVGDEQVKDNPFYAGHQWAQPSVAHTRALMRRVFDHREEAKEKGRAARDHILKNYTNHRSTAKVASRLMALDRKHAWRTAIGAPEEKAGLRVLFCIRPDLFLTVREDTKAVLRLKSHLEKAGLSVDLTGISDIPLDDYDLVHIFCQEDTYAMNAATRKKPFVVTQNWWTSCRFDAESMKVASLFMGLLNSSNKQAFEEGLVELRNSELPDRPGDCVILYSGAEAVFVNGRTVQENLANHFPRVKRVEVIEPEFDCDEDPRRVTSDLFVSEYGVEDFVLCTGPLEASNNQLMLLHALGDQDMPLVFSDSDTNQYEYEALCKRFKRKGKVVYTGKIADAMLYSAYRAAKVHVNPGWGGLTGTASFEAGWLGCNVVVSSQGPATDFFGDMAYRFDPLDPDGLKKAVLDAYHDPVDPELSKRLQSVSREGQARRIVDIYHDIHQRAKTPEGLASLDRTALEAGQEVLFREWKARAYTACRMNQRQGFDLALKLSQKRPDDSFIWFLLGTACMNLKSHPEAESHFRNCIELNPVFNLKGFLGLALALLKQEKYSDAVEILIECIDLNPLVPKETRELMYDHLKRGARGLIVGESFQEQIPHAGGFVPGTIPPRW